MAYSVKNGKENYLMIWNEYIENKYTLVELSDLS